MAWDGGLSTGSAVATDIVDVQTHDFHLEGVHSPTGCRPPCVSSTAVSYQQVRPPVATTESLKGGRASGPRLSRPTAEARPEPGAALRADPGNRVGR